MSMVYEWHREMVQSLPIGEKKRYHHIVCGRPLAKRQLRIPDPWLAVGDAGSAVCGEVQRREKKENHAEST